MRTEEFEQLWRIMQNSPSSGGESGMQYFAYVLILRLTFELGEPATKRRSKASDFPTQKNTLEGWLKKD